MDTQVIVIVSLMADRKIIRIAVSQAAKETLTDDLGNTYERIGLDYDLPIGAVEQASIYPGKTQLDLLIFQTPVRGAKTLTLTLPAERVGQTGDLVIRYQIR